MNKYSWDEDEDGPPSREYCGDLVIYMAVTLDDMAEFLDLPLAWEKMNEAGEGSHGSEGGSESSAMRSEDSEATGKESSIVNAVTTFVDPWDDFDVCPVKIIIRITIDSDGAILPSRMPRTPDQLHTAIRKLTTESFEIEFATGKTCNSAFASTVEHVFELVQPTFNNSPSIQEPWLTVKIADGLEGLKHFVNTVSRMFLLSYRMRLFGSS